MRAPRILIVEDYPLLLSMYEELFSDEHFEVFAALNGAQALELLEAGAQPDVLLMDLGLPIISGTELLALIRRDPALAQLPVVVVSGARSLNVEGADATLPKPPALDELIGAVRSLIHPRLQSACAALAV